MLVVDVFVYLILYFYLDEVLPNEYGISKSPLFFVGKKYWQDVFAQQRNKKRRP